MTMMTSESSSLNSDFNMMADRIIHSILYIMLPVLLLFLTSCVTERIEKRPVYPFAFAPGENNGRSLGRHYKPAERLPRSQYTGRGERREEVFVPARLERFTGNPHLVR